MITTRSLGAAWIGAGLLAISVVSVGTLSLVLRTPAGVDLVLAGESAGDVPLVMAAPREAHAPKRLSETGLYAADGSIDPRNRLFVPQYELWTDDADKRRFVRLPEGAKIDVSRVDAWRFPRGATFWKEFSWNGHKVETRMIRHTEQGEWVFAAYRWNEAQTEAVLVPAQGERGIFEVKSGSRHSIPAVADCLSCHGSAPAVILGFNALQLSDDRDPLAPHAGPLPSNALTLSTLVSEDRLKPKRPEWVTSPPRVRAEDPVARAAIGYLSGNCGNCHNASGPLARLGFSLLHDVAGPPDAPEPALATAAGALSRFPVPGVPGQARVLEPGHPERSALVHRMASRSPATQMPPFGTTLADRAAVALVRRWIEGLEASGANAAPATASRHRVSGGGDHHGAKANF